MNDPAPGWIQPIITFLVVVGVSTSAILLLRLLLSFLVSGKKVPGLLWRDAFFFLGVMGVVAGGYIWLWLGFTAPERPLWWSLISGTVLVIAAWIFAITEIRRIWRSRHRS